MVKLTDFTVWVSWVTCTCVFPSVCSSSFCLHLAQFCHVRQSSTSLHLGQGGPSRPFPQCWLFSSQTLAGYTVLLIGKAVFKLAVLGPTSLSEGESFVHFVGSDPTQYLTPSGLSGCWMWGVSVGHTEECKMASSLFMLF